MPRSAPTRGRYRHRRAGGWRRFSGPAQGIAGPAWRTCHCTIRRSSGSSAGREPSGPPWGLLSERLVSLAPIPRGVGLTTKMRPGAKSARFLPLFPLGRESAPSYGPIFSVSPVWWESAAMPRRLPDSAAESPLRGSHDPVHSRPGTHATYDLKEDRCADRHCWTSRPSGVTPA